MVNTHPSTHKISRGLIARNRTVLVPSSKFNYISRLGLGLGFFPNILNQEKVDGNNSNEDTVDTVDTSTAREQKYTSESTRKGLPTKICGLSYEPEFDFIRT